MKRTNDAMTQRNPITPHANIHNMKQLHVHISWSTDSSIECTCTRRGFIALRQIIILIETNRAYKLNHLLMISYARIVELDVRHPY